ncbi:solute carrier family 66 (lysosomal lysine-arginine transporter), member 1, partial [Lecanoromycetidae sp. Uapishka_2]
MSVASLADPSNLPDHCEPTSQYLIRFSSAFGSCVPTSLAFISTTFGVFSIVSWLFAQVPQIYKNYQLHSAAGLSIYFLAEWLLGDLTNLIGAVLTKQATWQVVVASYYVTVDVVLVGQYVWYSHLKARKEVVVPDYEESLDRSLGGSGQVLDGVSPSYDSDTSDSTIAEYGKDDTMSADASSESRDVHTRTPAASSSYSTQEKHSPKTHGRAVRRPQGSRFASPSAKGLLLVSVICVALTNASPVPADSPVLSSSPATSEFVGQIISWCSTLLYLGSRLPQIYKNAIRRSTAGLSPALFIAAFFGNLFYSTSLLTNPLAWASYPPYGLHGWVGPDGSDRTQWVKLAVPFWLGAAGVLALDATVGVQFLAFGEDMERSFIRIEDRKGRSRWRRVSGWMRGWVPSPSPERTMEVISDSEEGPLLGRRDREGRDYGTA